MKQQASALFFNANSWLLCLLHRSMQENVLKAYVYIFSSLTMFSHGLRRMKHDFVVHFSHHLFVGFSVSLLVVDLEISPNLIWIILTTTRRIRLDLRERSTVRESWIVYQIFRGYDLAEPFDMASFHKNAAHWAVGDDSIVKALKQADQCKNLLSRKDFDWHISQYRKN